MSTPDQRLANTFVALAGSLGPTHDLAHFLAVLTERSVELLGIDAAGAVFADGVHGAVQAGASDPRVAELELAAAGWKEGPAYDCVRTGVLPETALDGLPAQQRWPQYTPRARALGCARVVALPLRLLEETVGALVLFRNSRNPLDPGALALGQSLADAATIALLRERELTASKVLSAQLEQALSSRIVIEQAKGVLATRLTLSVDQAFDVLRGYARSHRTKLAEVALDVVEGRLRPGEPEKSKG
ncbi:GAF and ANTAR domain-containing protein [Streptomyces sp. NBC_01465]|uniref:GAF and ANTAR domain-containing protein n=1 Tax=Streptomyces sp. NBC_01465 TaxID=2903878 RepID=UPI002E3469AF|nr:GAF and ANTAR domain-containing protein [Streptomyces sp. NBC_01465]